MPDFKALILDRSINKRPWRTPRNFVAAGAAVLLALAAYFYLSEFKSLAVDPEAVTISEVKSSSFEEFITVNGNITPLAAVSLDASEGGKVEKIFVSEGSSIKKGQPILQFSNNDLQINLANLENEVLRVLSRMQEIRDNSDQSTLKQLNQLAEVENALAEAERVYKLNKYLFAEKAVGSQELKSYENSYKYQQKRLSLTRQALHNDSISIRKQLHQMGESYNRMHNSLALMRLKAADLIIRAPVDGQLTSLEAEVGEERNKGEWLGQVEVISGYKIRAELDEYYLSKVYKGMTGWSVLDGINYKLLLQKVYPKIVNGRFQVDMGFGEKVPAGLNKGHNLAFQLSLSDATRAMVLPRGEFFQQTGGSWVYKVSNDGSTAYKVDVQIGRRNPNYFEILEGLKAGDKVITSSYEGYGVNHKLVFKAIK